MKWRDVAKGLHFSTWSIFRINNKYDTVDDVGKLMEVITQWKKKGSPPFTMAVLRDVLAKESLFRSKPITT